MNDKTEDPRTEQERAIAILGHKIEELRDAIQQLHTQFGERIEEQANRLETLEKHGQLKITFAYAAEQ